MPDIYNVHMLPETACPPLWLAEAPHWFSLGRQVGANEAFTPLTMKALYVVGLILACCDSVSILLGPEHLISATFYPAYGVFASAIELLGRCIRGNTTIHGNQDLAAGFQWLAAPGIIPAQVSDTDAVLKTLNSTYSVKDLVALRHFSAHGQATKPDEIKQLDYLVLEEVPPMLGKAVGRYLEELRTEEMLVSSLAKARVTPYRNRPIFDALWSFKAELSYFLRPLPRRFGQDWTYKQRPYKSSCTHRR
jgi:hypothetical protein